MNTAGHCGLESVIYGMRSVIIPVIRLIPQEFLEHTVLVWDKKLLWYDAIAMIPVNFSLSITMGKMKLRNAKMN